MTFHIRRLAWLGLGIGLMALGCRQPTAETAIANQPPPGCYALTYQEWGVPPTIPAPIGGLAPQFISLHDGAVPDSVRARWGVVGLKGDLFGWLRLRPTDTLSFPLKWHRGTQDSVFIGVMITPDAGIGFDLVQRGDSLLGNVSGGSLSSETPPASTIVVGRRIPCWSGA